MYSIKKLFLKIYNIHKKAFVLKSLFNKVRPVTLLKRDSDTGVFTWNLRNFWIPFSTEIFPEHLRIAASMVYVQAFLISNTFISKTRLKLTENQAKAKQHPETERLLFENYSLSSSMLSSKAYMRYSKKCAKNKYVSFKGIIWLTLMKMRLKMKNGSQRYNINRTRPRHGHKYTKHKTSLSLMMVMCNKQHLSA